nr:hypothetical protein KK1_044198 [Cajanus cajan]
MHPSNDFTEPHATNVVHTNKDAIANPTKPGVVARLMGLDSLPSTNLAPRGNTNTTDSVPRSRSVNFVDYLLKFDTNQNHHHQVKTSASFREVPELFQDKNHDLVVLYLDTEDQQVGTLLRKQEMGMGESRQRKKQGSKNNNKEIVDVKGKKFCKFENEPRVVPSKHRSKVQNHNEAQVLASVSACSKHCSNRKKVGCDTKGLRSISTSPSKQKKVLSEPKRTRKTRKQESKKRIETDCSSQNLGPISVIDEYDYSFLSGPDFPDYTNPLKWECSEQLLLGDKNVGDRASKDKGFSYLDITRNTEYLSELTVNLRNLVENDIRESDFTGKRMCESESYRETCLEYEHKIFDILLHEVVNELLE